MIHNWSEEEAAAAQKQGWMLAEVWDGRRLSVEIARDGASNIFLTDAAARTWVATRGVGDLLCRRANLLVFESKIGWRPRAQRELQKRQ